MKNIPKKRFPEFANSGEWDKVKLNKLGKLVSGLTYNPNDIRENGLLVLRSSNVQGGQIKLEDNVYVRTDIKGANLTEPNDILICVRNGSKALIGKNALIPNNMPLCTHGAFMTIFRAKLPKFIYQLFQTKDYDRQVNADLGATINSINGGQFIKYEFNIPSSINEQQKIADCLSSVDSLILAQSQKVELLKEHKKGLLQNLFPTDGESVPRLRFPEFADDGEWEEKKLGEICKIARSGGTPTSTNKEYYNGNIPFLSIQDMSSQGKYLFTTSKTISQKGLDNSSSWIVPINTIIYSMYASVGLVSIAKIPLATSQAVINLIIKDNFCIEFVYYFLIHYKQYIYQFVETGTQGNLNAQTVKSLKVILPSPNEQQKIADCLSSVDELITSSTKKIELLKEHKKALLQQLFPSSEVVNG